LFVRADASPRPTLPALSHSSQRPPTCGLPAHTLTPLAGSLRKPSFALTARDKRFV
jgi:hypothetical protein